MADQAAVCAKERCEEDLPTTIQAPAASRGSTRTPNGASPCGHLRGKLELELWLRKKSCLAINQFEHIVRSQQVLVCVLSYGLDHEDWPRVVSDDIHRHLEKLRNKVVTLRGRAEGRTLLPLPLNLERARIEHAALRSVSSTAAVSLSTDSRTWCRQGAGLDVELTA